MFNDPDLFLEVGAVCWHFGELVTISRPYNGTGYVYFYFCTGELEDAASATGEPLEFAGQRSDFH